MFLVYETHWRGKNLRFLRWQAIAGLILATVVSASALDTKHPSPGTLTYVMGEAWIGTQPLNEKSAGSAVLKAGQSLTTEDGAAEVILAPEVYMRMGKDSSVQMISLNLTHVEVELKQGQAIVQVGELRKANAIRVLEHGVTTQLLKKGLYEFDADQHQVRVFKGEGAVQEGERQAVVKGGRQVALNFAGELSAPKFNKHQYETSDLYRFNRMRSKYLAEANAPCCWESYCWPGWRGSGRQVVGRSW
jgi:hypothetical protein